MVPQKHKPIQDIKALSQGWEVKLDDSNDPQKGIQVTSHLQTSSTLLDHHHLALALYYPCTMVTPDSNTHED